MPSFTYFCANQRKDDSHQNTHTPRFPIFFVKQISAVAKSKHDHKPEIFSRNSSWVQTVIQCGRIDLENSTVQTACFPVSMHNRVEWISTDVVKIYSAVCVIINLSNHSPINRFQQHMFILTLTHTHTHARTCTHTHVHTHTHSHTHPHTHVHTHTHTTHTHKTHTHTHTCRQQSILRKSSLHYLQNKCLWLIIYRNTGVLTMLQVYDWCYSDYIINTSSYRSVHFRHLWDRQKATSGLEVLKTDSSKRSVHTHYLREQCRAQGSLVPFLVTCWTLSRDCHPGSG